MSLQHAAHYLAAHGRGPDDSLVHMTRREVQSLQDIARAHGGSLSINPDTGLVEAGFLKNLLPMIAGAALTATTGIPAWAIGLGVGGAQAARTGSLEKGLMAGLGAYGGSGLMTGLTAAAGNTASELAAKDIALGGQGGSSAAAQYMPSATDNFMSGVKGLGTEAGRSAAINAMGGGFNAAKTAGMALAPALTDTGDQKAPSDNEAYNYKYDPGRVEDPNAGYTGAFTGERTYFKPSYTRLPNIKFSEGGVAHFDDGGPTNDPNKTTGLQAAAAAQGVQVPFAQQATPQQPAGSIQPVASNPFYTMTGASGDAYKYLMGLGPSSAATNPVAAAKPNITTDNTSSVDSGTKVVGGTGGIDRVTDPALLPPDTSTPSIYTKPIVSDIPDEVDPDSIPLITPETPLEVETIPTIYTKPIVSDIPDAVDPKDIPLITPETPLEVETIPTIYTKDIPSSIPDTVNPYDIPLITPETPLELPDIPKTPEKVDKSYFDDVNAPDPVGPNRAGAGDLPEEFDKYLSPETPMPTSKEAAPVDIAPADPSDFGSGFGGDPFAGEYSTTGYPGGIPGYEGYTQYGGASGGGKYFDDGGNAVMALATGGIADAAYNLGGYSDGGRLLRGPGDGVSDSIPATIGRKQQPARLADGEFVVPARIVSELGNGSTEAGARKLYAMMDRIQAARGKTVGRNRVATNTRADRHLPA